MNPDISIIITNYNYGKYIARCLRSCLSQVSVNHEVIVVDDCSTDDSLNSVKPFLNDITLLQTDENSGVSIAANLGISQARGQFFFRVDADDNINKNMSYVMKL